MLFERERFPRFQIGESLLPYNNDSSRASASRNRSRRDRFYAEVRRGIRHRATARSSYTFRFRENLPERVPQLVSGQAREFDELLLRNARGERRRCSRRDGGRRASILSDPSRAIVTTSTGERIEARFVVDASGHGAFLGNRDRREGRRRVAEEGRDLRALQERSASRGARRAATPSSSSCAMRWFWMIPVSADTMSVGLVVGRDHLRGCGLTPEELLRRTIDGDAVSSRSG